MLSSWFCGNRYTSVAQESPGYGYDISNKDEPALTRSASGHAICISLVSIVLLISLASAVGFSIGVKSSQTYKANTLSKAVPQD